MMRTAAHTQGPKVYVIGGVVTTKLIKNHRSENAVTFITNTTEVLSETGIWTTGAELNVPRWGHAAATMGGMIYVVGGCDTTFSWTTCSHPLGSAEVFDPITNTWKLLLNSMSRPRGRLTAAVYNNMLFAIGGEDGDGTGQRVVAPFTKPAGATIEMYTAETDSWTDEWTNETAANLPHPRSALGSAVLNGSLYVIGGINGNYDTNPAGTGGGFKVDIYNFSNASWSVGPPLLHPRWLPGVVATDGRIFVMGGGVPNSAGPLTSTEIYDPATCVPGNMGAQCWVEDAPMPVPRLYGDVVTVAASQQYHE